MIESNFWILLAAGLLGGGHCVGMCGGIVAALTLNQPAGAARWTILAGYNLGRIASYALIGALLGGLAAAGLSLADSHPFQLGLYALANLMLVAMGLYLAGLTGAIVLLEKIGQPVWRRLQPLLGRMLPIRSPASALAVGAVWGWLPCGLVYSASLSALASGSAWRGAGLMLAFGLGTLPNLLLMGVFADKLRRWMQQRPVRLAAGLGVAGLGAWRLLQLLI
ncbi:sulfite exporter TauE/SafE family protein [Chromobacterium sp. IIBBL 290-4]|uniref:sulfite exporter TauE/SafE family protein n=1 Tax=Chromobacterium sp. IIBBL 290-4 TaxID=2953890 RepID=UPI0020B64CDF|nr:sulfite exporter TauE/SafE family protein [Chromobacterium sp. IIBBL 290-4]UTH72968.1 sulfite exporter TauE/SafE family protein [Chromobacterium sp. IIBBL 290-4]